VTRRGCLGVGVRIGEELPVGQQKGSEPDWLQRGRVSSEIDRRARGTREQHKATLKEVGRNGKFI